MKITRVFIVPDLTCSNCVMKLEGLEDILPGIASIQGSYHRQTLQVEFDDEILAEEKLLEEIIRMGYSITTVR